MSQRRTVIAICLAGVMVCLLLVGIISSTVLRHVIQVIPIVLALVAVSRRLRLAPHFALPIFVMWALLMGLIWLYLMGFQTFFSGTFSLAEIVLTLAIAAFSIAGIVACIGLSSMAITQRAVALVLFAGLQVAAMWLWFLRPLCQ